jgi:hypothetical protein
MANRTRVTILEEGPRNAVVSIAGVLDTSNYTGAAAIAMASFTNNETMKTLSYCAVQCIKHSVQGSLTFVADWEATADQLAVALSGDGEIDFGPGLFPSDKAAAGFTGSFDLSTVGYVAASVVGFTVVLHLKKIYV